MMQSISGLEKAKSMKNSSVPAPIHSSSISSDSSETEMDLCENAEALKASKALPAQGKRWVGDRNRTQKDGQARPADKALKKSSGNISGLSKQRQNKRWKKAAKGGSKRNADGSPATDMKLKDRGQEFKEEAQWYTDPLTDNIMSNNSKSKLETAYKSRLSSFTDTDLLEKLPASIKDLCIDDSYSTDYLLTGAFVDGHFVDIPTLLDEKEFSEILDCSRTKSDSLDGLQKSVELFCEGDINQSALDSSAFDLKQDSGIVNFTASKTEELEEECSIILDGLSLLDENSIWEDGPTVSRVESLGSPLSVPCPDQFASDQVRFWLSSCVPASVDETVAPSFFKNDALLPVQDNGWKGHYEISFSALKDQCDNCVFSPGNTNSWESDSQKGMVTLEPTQSHALVSTEGEIPVEINSSFKPTFKDDWSGLCETQPGDLMDHVRNIESETFPIELNMAACIATACSEDDLLSLLPGSEYLQLDDSLLVEFQVERTVTPPKDKADVANPAVQLGDAEAKKWGSIFGICEENLFENTDDLKSRAIEKIWKVAPDEDKAALPKSITKVTGCQTSLGTELPLEESVVSKLQDNLVQKSECNFWEEKRGITERLGSMDTVLAADGNEWEPNSKETRAPVTGGVEQLFAQSNVRNEAFSPSDGTSLKSAPPYSTTGQPSSLGGDEKSSTNSSVENVEKQSKSNVIPVVLPECLWGSLRDILDDSRESSDSFPHFELGAPIAKEQSPSGSLDYSSIDQVNALSRTIPKFCENVTRSSGEGLQSASLPQDYSTSEQTPSRFCGSKSEGDKGKSECHIIANPSLIKEGLPQTTEFQATKYKETGMDKGSRATRETDKDLLNTVQLGLQALDLENNGNVAEKTQANVSECQDRTFLRGGDGAQQELQMCRGTQNELEPCKPSCSVSHQHSEISPAQARSHKENDCPKGSSCQVINNQERSASTFSENADCVCSRTSSNRVACSDAKHQEEPEHSKPEDRDTDHKMYRSTEEYKT
eukprot:gi/632978955/ref/XP_007906199.1/ PREDICTED: uncharacterized protein KIAA0232-like [Callorhinchus milii]